MLLIRRPKDACEAKLFIQNAHADTKKHVDEAALPHYSKFWKGLSVLLETGIFIEMHEIVSHNLFSQLVVNRGTPIFERTIRDHASFETIVTKQLAHRKYAKRAKKYDDFVANVLSKSRACIDRKEVKDDLRKMAQECNDAFSNDEVVECIRILYISMKSFRRMVKLLSSRMDRTFLQYDTFASNEAMQECEAQQIMSMVASDI